ncbi:MAG: riboflavin synthase [Bacteroidota bacterium]
MFTGIIEQTGRLTSITEEGTNKHFTVEAAFTPELKIDQSVAHNGVCLTVVKINGNQYTVTAIDETLKKTNLDDAAVNDTMNLERCMQANGRFDGHIVQGHVDSTARCTAVKDENGSWLFSFRLSEPSDARFIVDKGSICVNGISLTVVQCVEDMFSVAIIPYTFEHTNLKNVRTGTRVNIEYDIIGKYIAKMTSPK